jgi:hypothetical protein
MMKFLFFTFLFSCPLSAMEEDNVRAHPLSKNCKEVFSQYVKEQERNLRACITNLLMLSEQSHNQNIQEEAECVLAHFFLNGIGVPQDYLMARKFFLRILSHTPPANLAFHGEAWFFRGIDFYRGLGVLRDFDMALFCFDKVLTLQPDMQTLRTTLFYRGRLLFDMPVDSLEKRKGNIALATDCFKRALPSTIRSPNIVDEIDALTRAYIVLCCEDNPAFIKNAFEIADLILKAPLTYIEAKAIIISFLFRSKDGWRLVKKEKKRLNKKQGPLPIQAVSSRSDLRAIINALAVTFFGNH